MLNQSHEVVQGQRQSWNLITKLGEGDAGEVYLVEAIADNQQAILKRPRRGVFFSDVLRQASQIKTESTILRGLQRVIIQGSGFQMMIPTLIDQNKSETGISDQTFIIIEQARGLDLKLLSQAIHFGSNSVETPALSEESAKIIQQWAQFRKFPAPLLVNILLSVINLLEIIHTTEIRNEQGAQKGVIWNDVKSNHLYWDPISRRMTVIDWGNSQFVGGDGVSKDRAHSIRDDFQQFLQEIGSFLEEANPDLHSSLEWPQNSANSDVYEYAILPLKSKLIELHETDLDNLKTLRKQEADLYDIQKLELEQIHQFRNLQLKLAEYGELPDDSGAANFIFKAAYQMAVESRLTEFKEMCDIAAGLPTAPTNKWKLLSEIAGVASQPDNLDKQTQATFSNSLAAGVAGDWMAALWELFVSMADGPRPEWWEKISQEVRKVCLDLDPDSITPYTVAARVYYTLRAELNRIGERRLRAASESNKNQDKENGSFHWQASEQLLAIIREEIINKWKEIEPSPPYSGIDYAEVDSLIDQIEGLIPGTRTNFEKALAQPKAQVDLVLSAWELKDFEMAKRGLRSILVWDPDRARLFTAEKAIGSASQWLSRVRRGAGKDEPFYDYLTSVELAGRTLRNRVGPAKWLDDTLEAFKRLRKGSRSVDLMIEYPEILQELPWLNEYQSRELLSLPHMRPITAERDQARYTSYKSEGVVEGRFGPNQSMILAEALDTWMPEARGSSARVFAGNLHNLAKKPITLAFKIMRPDLIDYALPLFIEEIQILTMLRDVPGITPLVEFGYIKLNDGDVLPSDESHASAEHLSGQVIHYGIEQAQNYLASMERQLSAGWLPYLALVKRNPESNLLYYCDASHTHGWFLPLREGLILSIQICDILQFAHDRNIVYRDHKILHYYWDVDTHGVAVIDWNIAKRQPQGLSDTEKQFDLVQFGARGLHHIFTGRPAQGSLALGPNRAEDIEKASTHYPVSWTYDDERLPNQLRTILEMTLNQGYTQVRDIRQALFAIYQQLPGTDKS